MKIPRRPWAGLDARTGKVVGIVGLNAAFLCNPQLQLHAMKSVLCCFQYAVGNAITQIIGQRALIVGSKPALATSMIGPA